MPVELRIEGADKIAEVSRRLKETGDKELRREMARGINRATKPLKIAARAAVLAEYPKRGGLNEFVAKSRFTTRTRGGGKNPGVRIVVNKAGHDIRALDRGRLRHPLYGNRRFWYTQQIKPEIISGALRAGAELVRRQLAEVLDDIAKRIAR